MAEIDCRAMHKYSSAVPLASVLLLLSSCRGGIQPVASGSSVADVRLQGAGSSFVAPLLSKVFDELQKQKRIEVNYQPIGSGGGVSQLTKGTVDFGASDFPLNDEQTQAAEASGGPVVHVPVTIGAVSIGYNLPVDHLKLDGETLSGIYLGTIKTWTDPQIAALNAGVKLPSLPVVVVHRAEASGTTFIFTSYLAAKSVEWKSRVGAAGAVAWPGGVGAKGSEGVSGQVKSTPGAIGYFELTYSKQNEINSALLRNAAGKFVEASAAGAAAAAAGTVANMPPDLKAVFVNAPGEESYPVSGFSWIVVFRNQKDSVKGRAIIDMLRFVVRDGQQFAEGLHYAPLPTTLQDLDEKAIQSIVLPSDR
jgi:phosphate transport system substrate-binding protein